MRILLQVPPGMKKEATRFAECLEREGNTVFISGENIYGACDLREEDALKLNVDKIVHYGHTRFMRSEIPVEYKEVRNIVNVLPILRKGWKCIKEDEICLLTSLQFVDVLSDVKCFLERKGKKVVLPNGEDNEKKLYTGQVIGCYQNVPESEAYLYVGSGRFHALWQSFKGRAIYVLDVEKGVIEKLDTSLIMKQKYAAIGLAKQAKCFGILVSTKKGQFNLAAAEKIKSRLKESGKKAFIIVLDEFTPDKLSGFDCDCWINTACPRIATDNRNGFGKPIINIDELSDVF